MQDDITEWQGWPDDWLRAFDLGDMQATQPIGGPGRGFAPLVTQQSKIEEGEGKERDNREEAE
ncbi:uncharacterized protein TrAtP1_000140 [Trichoderma atroviride]|uniref:uncharacterized protein n=1 Tax=Hypocrea atroviridis TaxID=63577 RepID=UPI00331C2F22|nr:hypothetical protein TrAtP1_000140 [Trichoderma atroviride]